MKDFQNALHLIVDNDRAKKQQVVCWVFGQPVSICRGRCAGLWGNGVSFCLPRDSFQQSLVLLGPLFDILNVLGVGAGDESCFDQINLMLKPEPLGLS